MTEDIRKDTLLEVRGIARSVCASITICNPKKLSNVRIQEAFDILIEQLERMAGVK